MDPVTAIQLVASLVSLVKTCRTSLQAIKNFRDGDDDLAALVRDVDSFVAFLQGLEVLLGQYQRSRRNSVSENLRKALQDAYLTVVKLQRELDHVKKTEPSTFRRLKWLQGGAELQKLRSQIRDHSLYLNSFVLLICA